MKLFGTDLVLLHPPSIYDFRKAKAEYGPISDVIFSTPAFEMYPIGFTSIAAHLESYGFNVRIVNIAQRMVSDAEYDAEAAIENLDPAMFGIDLHWLPHAQGALAIAAIVKRLHPKTPIVFGGLSSSYFHDELILSPNVDLVMRGDSTEEPMRMLMNAVLLGGDLSSIPNLTWKDNEAVKVNALTNIPTVLNGGPVPDIFHVVRSVFKYGSLKDVVPFNNWLDYPITAVLTSRGCAMNCLVCGGSHSAYKMVCSRPHPAFRSPEDLTEDVKQIGKLSRAPVFLIHDLRMGGHDHSRRILELLKKSSPENEIVLELSSPVADDFLELVGDSLAKWSLEITLESHIERIRRRNKRFGCSNKRIEATIASALKNGARRIDLFFMIGLPGQSYEDAVNFDEFCRDLLKRFDGDKRLEFFAAPLAPFLDPGSEAYENPAESGYRLRYHTLEEHRRALLSPSWKAMLNYETDSMTRDEIVAASYEAMRRLAGLKQEWGMMTAPDAEKLVANISASEAAVAKVDLAFGLADPVQRDAAVRIAAKAAQPAATASIFQKNYLVWPLINGHRFASVLCLAGVGLKALIEIGRLFFRKRLPLYFARWSSSPDQALDRVDEFLAVPSDTVLKDDLDVLDVVDVL